MVYEKSSDNLFLAVALSMFTFVLYYFGFAISLWYFSIGFVSMIGAIWYWVKVKKGSSESSW